MAVDATLPDTVPSYERGLIEPSGPMIQLIKVLDRHPEIVEELR